MVNNVLLFVSIIGVFSIMLLIKRFLGKEGLIGWMGIASILANILIIKSVDMLGINSTLGNVMFASNFLATDILTECYGYKEAKKGIKFGIVSVLVFFIVSQVALHYIPNSEDIAQTSFETLFSLVPRITIASVSLFALSNFIDVRLYEWLRKKSNGKRMWLRNNLCTILCNGGENFLFYFIAFGGIMSLKTEIAVGISATIIETLIAVCDTPFLYISKKIKN